jgi:hypothetical protein
MTIDVIECESSDVTDAWIWRETREEVKKKAGEQ